MVAAATARVGSTPVKEATPWRRFRRRMIRNRFGMGALLVLFVLVLAGVLSPIVAPHPPGDANFATVFQRPGTVGYVLGTDNLGRDILSRVLYGIRASLEVGVLAVLIAFVVGVPAGLLAGAFRTADVIASRGTDLLLAFPFLIMAIGVAAILGPSLMIAAVAIGIGAVPSILRVMRVETARIISLDYVTAARAQGAGTLRILSHYVLPNAASSLIVRATVIMPGAILGESTLSFLGLGIQPPMPSLGGMLADAQQYAEQAPWMAVVPGAAIVLICLSFNTLGDALRDALDVQVVSRD
ncbi:glutathione ABC transporter permease GsiD [Microlunatus endophyticus]|uniref:Glutathione ABC transporter permease GsiD n=1 Tax=Microlunatus endophyticus TaxID=1716077 RepID=A0A917S606_9ACTN|nr:ABC transporter permease [Microlunatus endophyticus]GGL61050.1 glutathione ABC transporter permease GsiD [Microlunatus endophyticus]